MGLYLLSENTYVLFIQENQIKGTHTKGNFLSSCVVLFLYNPGYPFDGRGGYPPFYLFSIAGDSYDTIRNAFLLLSDTTP